jgi:hypothetical protein
MEMGDKPALRSPSDNELVAGPPWSPGIRDLARLRALTRRNAAVIHSNLRGTSMGSAIPDGARIRIRSNSEATWRRGQVIAFLAGSRIMTHRIVYEGRRSGARNFVVTQGDGNWLCDPPVNRSTILGEVEAFSTGGEWRRIAPSRMPLHRRIIARPSQALMRLLLECNPALAIWFSRPISWLRMGPRLVLLKLRRYRAEHVRH